MLSFQALQTKPTNCVTTDVLVDFYRHSFEKMYHYWTKYSCLIRVIRLSFSISEIARDKTNIKIESRRN